MRTLARLTRAWPPMRRLQHWRDLRLAHARDLATGPCRAAGEPSVVACRSRPASAVPMDVEDRDHASDAPETAPVASFVHQDVEPTRTDAAALGAALLGVGGSAAPTPGAPGPLSISWPELALALPPIHAVDPHARAHPPDAPPPPPPTQHVPPSPPPPPSVPKVQLAAAPQQTLPPNRAPLAALSASNRCALCPAALPGVEVPHLVISAPAGTLMNPPAPRQQWPGPRRRRPRWRTARRRRQRFAALSPSSTSRTSSTARCGTPSPASYAMRCARGCTRARRGSFKARRRSDLESD